MTFLVLVVVSALLTSCVSDEAERSLDPRVPKLDITLNRLAIGNADLQSMKQKLYHWYELLALQPYIYPIPAEISGKKPESLFSHAELLVQLNKLKGDKRQTLEQYLEEIEEIRLEDFIGDLTLMGCLRERGSISQQLVRNFLLDLRKLPEHQYQTDLLIRRPLDQYDKYTAARIDKFFQEFYAWRGETFETSTNQIYDDCRSKNWLDLAILHSFVVNDPLEKRKNEVFYLSKEFDLDWSTPVCMSDLQVLQAKDKSYWQRMLNGSTENAEIIGTQRFGPTLTGIRERVGPLLFIEGVRLRLEYRLRLSDLEAKYLKDVPETESSYMYKWIERNDRYYGTKNVHKVYTKNTQNKRNFEREAEILKDTIPDIPFDGFYQIRRLVRGDGHEGLDRDNCRKRDTQIGSLQIKPQVQDLIFYRLYRNKNIEHANSRAIAPLVELVEAIFLKLKASAPKKHREELSNIRFEVNFDAKQPIAAHGGGGHVSMTPSLIRAVFIGALSQHGREFIRRYELQEPTFSLDFGDFRDFGHPSGNPLREIEATLDATPKSEGDKSLQEVIRYLSRAWSFILAHEMAHNYEPSSNEFVADCLAYSHLSQGGKRVDVGAFEDIVARLISEGRTDLLGWDSATAPKRIKDFERRRKFLSNYSRKGATEDCSSDALR